MDQTQIKANAYADPLALAQLIDALDGRDGFSLDAAAKHARKFLDELLTQIAHRSQSPPSEVYSVNLSDRDWVQILGYVGFHKFALEERIGEEAAEEDPSYKIAESLRQDIIKQLSPQRQAARQPKQRIQPIKFNALPKALQDRLDGAEDMTGIEEVRSGDKVEYKVRFEVGAEYWYKFYNADGTDAGGSVRYLAKDPEILEAGNSTEAERGFY